MAGLCLLAPVLSVEAGTADIEMPLATTAPVDTADEWEFAFSLNGWGPAINGNTVTGASIDITLGDILENLNMMFQTSLGARKGRWFVGADLVYLNMQTGIYSANGPLKIKTDVELTAFISTPVGGYTLFEGDWGRFAVLAGARYLYLKVDTGVVVSDPLAGTKTGFLSESGSQWAGVIGFKGRYNISENWYLPFYFDYGTGDPDMTVQAFAGVAYRTRCYDVVLGYRYLKWNLDRGAPLTNLEIKGPILGVKWEF